MQDGATLLHAHVVATTQDLAVLGDQAGADGDAALGRTLPCLLHSCDETGVLLHGDCAAIEKIEVVWREMWKLECGGCERRRMTLRAYLQSDRSPAKFRRRPMTI